VSYVSTSSFIQDANISANAVATSLTLFSATYVPLQPISALAARRVGAKYWLAILLITWGAFCMAHAAIKNEATFMALRLLLGATESGFMPVGFYFMSLVYPKYALGFRAGCFSGMYSIAGAFAGLIAYGLLKVGSSHIKGWQVLFLFEGGLTVLTGFITLLVLPKNLETAWFLTPLERQHAVNRMHRDNMAFWNPESDMQQDSESKNGSITLRDITDVLKDWKKMLIILFNILAILPVTAFTTFLPQMVEGMGYQGVKATVMSVPPFIVGTVGLLVMVWSSDRFKERSLHTVAGMSLALIGCIVMVTSTDPRLRYGFSHVCLAGTFVAGPLVAVWLAGNTPLGVCKNFLFIPGPSVC
jgi:MFS family permease